MAWALARLHGDNEAQRWVLDALDGHVLALAFDPSGSRVLQDALQVGQFCDHERVACELEGSLHRAVVSPHASYVVEKLIEVLPADEVGSFLGEISPVAPAVARDRRGCRVLCRALERHGFRSGGGCALDAVVEGVLEDAAELSRHPFGHHVVESVLVHGSDLHRQHFAIALRGRLTRGARNRSASYVVQRALCTCAAPEIDAMVEELLGKPQNLPALARSQYGCHVVKSLLQLGGPHERRAREQLECVKEELRADKYGSRLLEELEI